MPFAPYHGSSFNVRPYPPHHPAPRRVPARTQTAGHVRDQPRFPQLIRIQKPKRRSLLDKTKKGHRISVQVCPMMDTIPNNLPLQLSSFIGREQEITEVKRLLTTTRLLMLTGSGGTGKTRLALQVAADILDSFADGVWFVELAAISDPALVPATIASVVGVQEEPDRPVMSTLLDWLRPKQLLFILDNCEHLLVACAECADAVLHASRETCILASSREALGIAGELTWRVPSLPAPNPSEAMNFGQLDQYAAVRLFIERAAFALPTFALSSANATAVAQICYRLDGIPLAIELAAARVKALPIESIATRLDDRFRLLTGGSRTALPRQQTLRALVDWSHGLLSEPERALLRRLSVFAGGWTLDTAEAVCAGERVETTDVLDLLTHLVDKSLVALEENAAAPRYRMLETIRQYARERLLDAQESERLRDRHLSFFVELAEHAEPILQSGQRADWMPRLEAEHDNLSAALEWACERDLETARWLAGLLRWFWSLGDHLSEAHAWYERVLGSGERLEQTKGTALALLGAGTIFPFLAAAQARDQLKQSVAIWRTLDDQMRLADALTWLAYTLTSLGQAPEAYALCEANEAFLRQHAQPSTLAFALCIWGNSLVLVRGDYVWGKALMEESLAISKRRKDQFVIGHTLSTLGYVALQEGDYAAARRYQLESLSSRRQGSTRWLIALSLGYVADAANLEGDYAPARPMYVEALALYRAIGHQLYVARLLVRLGYLAVHERAAAEATALFAEALDICRERAFQVGLVQCVAAYAELRRAQGRLAQAVRLLAVPALLPLRQMTGNPFDHIEYQRSVDAARAQLDASTFEAAWVEGSALTLEQAIAEAQREAVDAPPAPAASPPTENSAGLSAREVEVLQLLAAGLTNTQIAERLTLSTYTVQAHLRSIYSKLGVTTRVAAARAAAQFK